MLKPFRIVLKVLIGILGFAIFVGTVFIALLIYFNSVPALPPHSTESITIETNGDAALEIRVGESSTSVGKRLQDAGIIKSSLMWMALSRFEYRLSENNFIKTGAYTLKLPLTSFEIFAVLKEGRQTLIRVTIPEGITLSKIAKILQDNGICSGDDFLGACRNPAILHDYRVSGVDMQGYLFPETYLFQANYPAEKVVKAMADTFFDRLTDLGININALKAGELNKKVILASIIEREYRIDDEAAVMSGVFNNRLNKGIKLESCATVEYIITEIQGKPHPERLFNRDIAIQNPYNTYIFPGLPPGPISEPGETALKAAFFPDTNDYLFFRVIDPAAGRHYFSKTFDDHIKAGELYIKARR